MIRDVGLFGILREDFHFHRQDWIRPGLQTLWIHHIGANGASLRRPGRPLFTILPRVSRMTLGKFFGSM